ncbi:NADH-cytochrome b5 reductase-like [Coemansia guatemalensis]|uniref:NADH-cytochrome b5 reductase-like n=1 Tax=Coemansia guatemalensis TaxID=2761395 RepID=A0A9W8HNP2_9FUNG|nr:NADH-cytochrome b5 reductase-like [Coemansia guatemalensis]
MSKPVNSAVQELLAEIARAKLQAEERRRQKEAASKVQYGVVRDSSGKIELHLPPPPIKPSADDCCQSGCTPCIMDTYREQLCEHKCAVRQLQEQYERAVDGQPPISDPHPATRERLSYGILDPLRFTKVRIMHIDTFCQYSRLLVLEASAKDFVLALGEHVHIRTQLSDGRKITRPFTPVMIEAEDGVVRPHLFVRLYDNNVQSEYFRELVAGSCLMVRGPVTTNENLSQVFGGQLCALIAGGSGIAPIFQALQFAHLNERYRLQRIIVIHCARDSSGLWLAKSISELEQEMPQLSYHTFLSREIKEGVVASDTMTTGRLCEDSLKRVLLQEENATTCKRRALVCGPGTFNSDVEVWLRNMGFDDVQVL